MKEITSYYTTLEKTLVAELLLRYLKLEGVTKIFGVPGGAIMHLLDVLKEQSADFQYFVCRQETGATYIADGYARVSDSLGVVAVTSGPGATNALTGTMNAQNSGSAVLTITGEVPEAYFGKGYLQEGIDASLNINAIYSNASGYSAVITNPANFQTLFTQALRDALTLPHRAAHISLPDDVSAAPLTNVQMPKNPANYRAMPRSSDPDTTRLAFQALIAAEKPLFLLGNGCREALQRRRTREDITRLEKLTEVVEKFGIPVMTTPNAKGIFPESHPLSLRNYGIAGCMWPQYYMGAANSPDHYDGLMIMGSTLGQLATNKWDEILVPHGPLIQVDLSGPVIARDFPVEYGIIAEIGHVIDDLYTYALQTSPDAPAVSARKERIAALKAQVSPYFEAAKRESDAVPILPQALMGTLNGVLPANSHVFVDAGNSVGWCLNYLEIDPPCRLHNSLAMGPMGFAVGAVIGAKIADPDAVCIGVVGDGAFMMHGNEVSTAAQYQVGAIWVVLNDNDLAMVSQGMNQFFKGDSPWNDYYKLGNPDLVKFAEALGATAREANSPQEVRDALEDAMHRTPQGPYVIVVSIERSETPPYYIQHPSSQAAPPPPASAQGGQTVTPAMRESLVHHASPNGAN